MKKGMIGLGFCLAWAWMGIPASAGTLAVFLEPYKVVEEFAVAEESGTTIGAKTDTAVELTDDKGKTGTVVFDVSSFQGNQAAFQLTGVSAYEAAVHGDFGGVSVFWQESMVNEDWAWSGATSTPVIAEEADSGNSTVYIPFEIDAVGYARLRVQFLSAVSKFSGVLKIFRKTE